MKSIIDVRTIIFDYAKDTPLFISPTVLNDPIVPSPDQMSDSQFNRFFSTLHNCLADSQVQTHIRLAELRAVDTWAGLASIIFARQTA